MENIRDGDVWRGVTAGTELDDDENDVNSKACGTAEYVLYVVFS